MSPIVRNTLFTLAMLFLSGLGLSWNSKTIKNDQPIFISQNVLAAPPSHNFPVIMAFEQPAIKLGQTQSITIITQPNSDLQIAIQFANGTLGNGLKAQANKNGYYSFNFTENNFRDAGTVMVKVIANSKEQTSSITGEYTLSP